MAFTVNDVQDLIRLLAAHPEWRAELRPLILGDEFQELPGTVRELSAAQNRTQATVEELADAQRRTEVSLASLTEEVRALSAEVKELGAEVKSLSQQVRDLTRGLATLAGVVGELSREVREYVGPMYEMLFTLKAGALFGRWLRRPRVTGVDQLEALETAEASGSLTPKEIEALYALDLLMVGGDKRVAGAPETFMAVEISRTIDRGDISRAVERAELLRRLGYLALPAVGGREIGPREQQFADEQQVIVRLVNQVA